MNSRKPWGSTRISIGGFRGWSCAALLALSAGCASETLFQSNFDSNPTGAPPVTAQAVGTATVDGPAGSVTVVPPPVAPSGRWVEIRRTDVMSNPLPAFQGNCTAMRGDGKYVISAVMFIRAESGLATLELVPFGQPVSTFGGFLHLDFMQDHHVRIDDDPSTEFGDFQYDQPFMVQITLNVGATTHAHVALGGAGASGDADRDVAAPLRFQARQFGAVRLWMGAQWTGTFDATNIVVTRKSD